MSHPILYDRAIKGVSAWKTEDGTKSIVVAQYVKVLAGEALKQNLYPDAGDFSESMIEKLEISGKRYDIGLAGIGGTDDLYL